MVIVVNYIKTSAISNLKIILTMKSKYHLANNIIESGFRFMVSDDWQKRTQTPSVRTRFQLRPKVIAKGHIF